MFLFQPDVLSEASQLSSTQWHLPHFSIINWLYTGMRDLWHNPSPLLFLPPLLLPYLELLFFSEIDRKSLSHLKQVEDQHHHCFTADLLVSVVIFPYLPESRLLAGEVGGCTKQKEVCKSKIKRRFMFLVLNNIMRHLQHKMDIYYFCRNPATTCSCVQKESLLSKPPENSFMKDMLLLSHTRMIKPLFWTILAWVCFTGSVATKASRY